MFLPRCLRAPTASRPLSSPSASAPTTAIPVPSELAHGRLPLPCSRGKQLPSGAPCQPSVPHGLTVPVTLRLVGDGGKSTDFLRLEESPTSAGEDRPSSSEESRREVVLVAQTDVIPFRGGVAAAPTGNNSVALSPAVEDATRNFEAEAVSFQIRANSQVVDRQTGIVFAKNDEEMGVLDMAAVSVVPVHPSGHSDEQDDSVKARSFEQRAAGPGEPSCVVCNRYGEYICDETDDDVCSLECKAAVLAGIWKTVPLVNSIPSCPDVPQTASTNIVRSRDPACLFSGSDPLLPGSKSDSKFTPAFDLRDRGRSDGAEVKGDTSRGNGKGSRSISSLQDECIWVQERERKLPEWEPDSSIQKLTQQQVDALLSAIEVSVKGSNVPRPILEFSDCRFLPKLQENLQIAGYDSPTPVQMQAIPVALKGRDVLVSADTGSGKTAAFLLPILLRCCLIRIHCLSERERPLAMVLAPTRELCAQVEEQAKALAKGLPFKTALVVGGDAMPQQLYRIKQGVELIVGTPGRLIDLLIKHDIDLQDVCMLALDEVDCMLERGFREQVLQLVQALSSPQILMYSATIPPAIEKFAASILKNPLCVAVGKPSVPSGAVKQTLIWVDSNKKKKKLFDILQSASHFRPPVVVFVSSRMGADLLSNSIRTVTGLQATSLHGDKPMQERRETIQAFLTGELPVIVATGILGRGLDLISVTQVIVFDMPRSLPEYIHQIGRASRLGKPGSAFVFINNESKALFKELVGLLRSSETVIPRELANSPYLHSTYAVAYNTKKRKQREVDSD